jgi:pimeloyl-ACP methyl ester carboxylesterase
LLRTSLNLDAHPNRKGSGMSIRLGALLVIALLVSCAGGEPEPADRMVDLGTHRLHAVVLGDGLPPVIIDGGIGAGAQEYLPLQERLAEVTTAVTYDRAGYGQSEMGPLPRDSKMEAGELKAMLAELNLSSPYVMVGHSLGGLNIEVFADLYPENVAGVVLLDPPPLGWLLGEKYQGIRRMAEGMTAEWQNIADRGINSMDEQERRQAQLFQMLASEHRAMLGTSARLAAEIESFGDMPLVVIAAGVPNPMFGDDAAGYQEYWIEENRRLAEKSSRGKFNLADESTHHLHADATDLVTDAIVSMVEEARNQ